MLKGLVTHQASGVLETGADEAWSKKVSLGSSYVTFLVCEHTHAPRPLERLQHRDSETHARAGPLRTVAVKTAPNVAVGVFIC